MVTNADKYADKLTSERGLGAETAQDLALLSVEDLVAAKIPVADAKALAHLFNGRAVESGDDCNQSGATTSLGGASGNSDRSVSMGMSAAAGSAAFVESLQEISKSTREGMKSAVKLSKKKYLAELKHAKPKISAIVAFGEDIYRKRGQKTDMLGTLIKKIAEAPHAMSLGEVKEAAADATEGSEDHDLATDIVGAVKSEVIDELSASWTDTESGVVLYYLILQQAIKRPFRLLRDDLKTCTEG